MNKREEVMVILTRVIVAILSIVGVESILSIVLLWKNWSEYSVVPTVVLAMMLIAPTACVRLSMKID